MTRWHPVLKLLHWTMAAILLGMVGAGLLMARAADKAAATGDFSARVLGLTIFDAYQLHKSAGIVLFALVLVRLIWRLTHRSPALPAAMHRVEKLAAHGSHVALYALMLSMPFTGWLLASASPLGIPTVVFGVLPLPHPIGPDAGTEAVLSRLHFAGGLALVTLAGLYVAAALKHHFLDGDDVLRAMLPGLDPRTKHTGRFGAVLAMLLALPGVAEAQTEWVVEPADSTLTFSLTIGGAEATGGFSDWSAEIAFDPETLDSGTVEVLVDTASVFIDTAQARGVIAGPDWLAVGVHPQARFSVEGFDWSADGELALDGTLTLLGVAYPLTLTGHLHISGQFAVATVSGTIDRLTHGLGGENPAVSQGITVTADLRAVRDQD